MRHISGELLIMVMAAATMAMMVLIVGIAIPRAPRPAIPPLVGGGRGDVEPRGCHEAAVMAPPDSRIGGHGMFCSGDAGANATVRLTGLTPGGTYSTWLSYATDVFADPPTSSDTIVWRGGAPDRPPRLLDEGVASLTGALELSEDLPGFRLRERAQVTLSVLEPGGPAGLRGQMIFPPR